MTRGEKICHEPVAPIGATFTTAILGQAFRAIVRVWTALKNRRQVTLLNQLDDRALKDIGLVRSDVDAALCVPLHRDPSIHLVDVSGHAIQPAGSQHAGAAGQKHLVHRLRRFDAVVTAKPIGAAIQSDRIFL